MDGTLFFHSPCFDGIASAVLMADFLAARGWSGIELKPVNYDRRDSWLSEPLPKPCAVVDFLYHPDAPYWADHHGTTFLTDEARADGSLSLAPDANAYCVRLVQALRVQPLAQVTDLPEVRDLSDKALGQQEQGVRIFRAAINKDKARSTATDTVAVTPDEIVVFDITDDADCIDRYTPYYFFPQARYSIGITRCGKGGRITTMRNPWREFASAPLGTLCAPEGGGHERVGAIILPAERSNKAGELLERIVSGIRAFHAETI